MATFVHHRADKIGALTLMSALVLIAAPAAASTVTLVSQAGVRPGVFEFEETRRISELPPLGIALRSEAVAFLSQALTKPFAPPLRPLLEPSAGLSGFDFASAGNVARQIFDATIQGPGSDLFGLVGLALWAVWWRRLPPLYS